MKSKNVVHVKSFLIALIAVLLISACGSSNEQEVVNQVDYQELGLEITNAAFVKLSGSLMEAMDRGGVKEAIDYCHLEAYPLTELVSSEYGAHLRRVASRFRNPKNAPEDWEIDLIKYYESFESPSSAKDTLIELSDATLVYARPILLQGPCVKCHGHVGTDVADVDYQIIKEKYPDDRAIGFAPGDLRGMWVVKFIDKY